MVARLRSAPNPNSQLPLKFPAAVNAKSSLAHEVARTCSHHKETRMALFCRTGFKRVVHLLGIVGLLACQGLSQAGPGGLAARPHPPGISPGPADIQAYKANDSRR